MLMFIFKACSKKLKILIFQKPNFLHGRFPKHRTPINSRFSENFGKQTCFSKLFTGNNWQSTRKIKRFSKNHKLLEQLSSNAMKSSDFVVDRSCFCLLRSVVYVQRLQSGVNIVSKPHLLVISSNFIRYSFPRNKIYPLKLFTTTLKDTFGKIFRVFEINLSSIWNKCFSANYLPFYGFYGRFPLQYSACAFNLSSQQIIERLLFCSWLLAPEKYSWEKLNVTPCGCTRTTKL